MGNHSLKIYQADVHTKYAFRSYAEARKAGADFKTLKDYHLVFDGGMRSYGTKSNDILEEVFTSGNIGGLRQRMAEFYDHARSISVSDIIELDGTKYYCNPCGFAKVTEG